jgi:hypothetical protein
MPAKPLRARLARSMEDLETVASIFNGEGSPLPEKVVRRVHRALADALEEIDRLGFVISPTETQEAETPAPEIGGEFV